MKVAIFQFAIFGINSYVVYDPDTRCCAIIDPGMTNCKEENAIVDFIDRNKLSVKYVINTHLHIDHAVGNEFLKDKYNVPVLAHELDRPLVKECYYRLRCLDYPNVSKTLRFRNICMMVKS